MSEDATPQRGEQDARPPRRAWRRRALAMLAGLVLASLWAVDVARFFARPIVIEGESVRYTIPPGASLRAIARDLGQRGWLTRPHYLVGAAILQGDARKLRAGEYEFRAGLTPLELLDQVVKGRVVQHSFTLVEGWTFHQIVQALAERPELTHSLAGLEAPEVMVWLGHPGQDPEGRFFPDTYLFTRGTADLELLKRAYQAMEAYLAKEWPRRASGLPYAGPEQALVLASIVEKETARAEERPEVAGVFVRRLQQDMPLQTDPSVIYGLGAGFDGNLRRQHLEHDTPYNTYVRTGLPPTPIAMPGAASIRAVLHPASGKALYFVARGDGSHEFSDTLQEHARAVLRYQLNRSPGS